MTVDTGQTQVVYVVTSSAIGTQYTIPFPYLTEPDVKVAILPEQIPGQPYKPRTFLVYMTDYEVNGSTMSTLISIPAGTKLTVYRETAVTQDILWVDGQMIYAPSIMAGDDKLTYEVQELWTTMGRAILTDEIENPGDRWTAEEWLQTLGESQLAAQNAAAAAAASESDAEAAAAQALASQTAAASSATTADADAAAAAASAQSAADSAGIAEGHAGNGSDAAAAAVAAASAASSSAVAAQTSATQASTSATNAAGSATAAANSASAAAAVEDGVQASATAATNAATAAAASQTAANTSAANAAGSATAAANSATAAAGSATDAADSVTAAAGSATAAAGSATAAAGSATNAAESETAAEAASDAAAGFASTTGADASAAELAANEAQTSATAAASSASAASDSADRAEAAAGVSIAEVGKPGLVAPDGVTTFVDAAGTLTVDAGETVAFDGVTIKQDATSGEHYVPNVSVQSAGAVPPITLDPNHTMSAFFGAYNNAGTQTPIWEQTENVNVGSATKLATQRLINIKTGLGVTVGGSYFDGTANTTLLMPNPDEVNTQFRGSVARLVPDNTGLVPEGMVAYYTTGEAGTGYRKHFWAPLSAFDFGGVSPVVFTTSGTYMPTKTGWAFLLLAGGGGGGGCGGWANKNATNTNFFRGGGGGGGGAGDWFFIPVYLTVNIICSITIGAGGTAGQPSTGSIWNTQGGGSPGGTSSFDTGNGILSVIGGSGGGGGGATQQHSTGQIYLGGGGGGGAGGDASAGGVQSSQSQIAGYGGGASYGALYTPGTSAASISKGGAGQVPDLVSGGGTNQDIGVSGIGNCPGHQGGYGGRGGFANSVDSPIYGRGGAGGIGSSISIAGVNTYGNGGAGSDGAIRTLTTVGIDHPTAGSAGLPGIAVLYIL